MKITSCKNAGTWNARNAFPCNPHPRAGISPRWGMYSQHLHIHAIVSNVEYLYGQCFHLLPRPCNIQNYLSVYSQVDTRLYTDTYPLHTCVYLCTHRHSAYVCLFRNRQRFCGWSNSWALLAPSETAAIFRMYNAVFWLYNAANAGMCNTGCKSWQAKQFLFGSGYFTVVCLWYNTPFCLVLRHRLLILCCLFLFFFCTFVSGFIIWNVSARIMRSTPILNNRA